MKEIFRSFRSFGGPQNKNQRPQRSQPYQATQNPRPQPQRNDGVVPMDVDATSMAPTIPFKKLTPEERKQYMAEGRCFRCCLQGHMAQECPKNTQHGGTSTVRATTTPSTSN